MITEISFPMDIHLLNSSYIQHFEGRFPKMEKVVVANSSSTSSGHIFVLGNNSINQATSLNIQEHSTELLLLQRKAGWYADFFNNANTLNDVKTVFPYYQKIDSLLSDKEFNVCDALLSQTNTKSLSDVLLIGLLRLTYNWRTKLPSWPSLLADTNRELLSRGYDSKRLLRGLI